MQENTKCAQLLKQEIHRELQDMDNTSLDIFRMFKSNNNLLPKNKRILNLSWRMNSINRVKKNSKRNKTKHLSVNVNEKLDFLSHSLNSTSPSDSISLMSKQASYSTLGSCSPTKYCNNNISLLNNNHSENLINHNPNSSDSTEFDYIEHIRRLSREEYGITKNSSSTHYSSLSPEKNFFSLSKQATKSSLSTKRYPSNLTDTDLSSRSMENKNNKKIDFSLDLSDEFNIESYLNFGDSMNNLSTSHSKDLSNYISTLESSLNNESYIHNHTHVDNYPTPLTITTSPTLTQSSKLSPGKSSTGQPVCENCFTTTTPLWRKTTDHRLLCNACGLFFKLHGVIRPPANQPESTVSNDKKEYSATKNINIVDLGSAYNTDDIHMGETLASDWDWLKFDI